MIVVHHGFEPRWRRAMRRGRSTVGRKGRFMLAAVLAAASVGWVGGGTSAASPPAELDSVTPGTTTPLVDDSSSPSVSGDGNIVVFNTSAFNASLGIVLYTVYVRNRANGTTATVPGLPPSSPCTRVRPAGSSAATAAMSSSSVAATSTSPPASGTSTPGTAAPSTSAAVEIADQRAAGELLPRFGGGLRRRPLRRLLHQPGFEHPPKVARIDTTTRPRRADVVGLQQRRLDRHLRRRQLRRHRRPDDDAPECRNRVDRVDAAVRSDVVHDRSDLARRNGVAGLRVQRQPVSVGRRALRRLRVERSPDAVRLPGRHRRRCTCAIGSPASPSW